MPQPLVIQYANATVWNLPNERAWRASVWGSTAVLLGVVAVILTYAWLRRDALVIMGIVWGLAGCVASAMFFLKGTSYCSSIQRCGILGAGFRLRATLAVAMPLMAMLAIAISYEEINRIADSAVPVRWVNGGNETIDSLTTFADGKSYKSGPIKPGQSVVMPLSVSPQITTCTDLIINGQSIPCDFNLYSWNRNLTGGTTITVSRKGASCANMSCVFTKRPFVFSTMNSRM